MPTVHRDWPPALERLRAATNFDGPTLVPELGPCHVYTKHCDDWGYGILWATGIPTRKAHRIAWLLQVGPIPAGLLVLHRCDNPPCVRLDHLFLGTTTDNVADRDTKGRQQQGTRHHSAKLSDEDVIAIRAARAAGKSRNDLAKQYSIHPAYVYQLVHRASRKAVP